MSLSNYELLSNIKRQAKRFSKSFNIPLRQAQKIFAISIYQCNDWLHLRESLKLNSFDNQLLLLASLQPQSDTFLYKLLNENLDDIILRIKENTAINLPKSEIEKIIVNLFGIEHIEFKGKVAK